ncbi:sulfatase-like hydrolase/transferase [Candidatus Sumerlaeota bacterium]|nr:sulfatase-like hydrolase/transferase [Candidatus Sumerlaeota bacterium]
MRNIRLRFRVFLSFCSIFLFAACATPSRPGGHKTENVIMVVWDGYRQQEMFGGAQDILLNKTSGGVKDVPDLKSRYWKETPEARRETLMPFIWGTIAQKGQIFGDMTKKSRASVTNGMKFSYPGYNEMFCGFGDPRIDSNDKKNNPNLSVLEFLNGRPLFAHRVSIYCTWDVFHYIFREESSKLPVQAGWNTFKGNSLSERQRAVNKMVVDLPHIWGDNTYDLLSMEGALDSIERDHPRVLFIGLGETDEWAHARRYDVYLDAARNADRFMARFWEKIQKMPQYKDKTTLIMTADHGRGSTPVDWTDHGQKVPEAENIWIAVMGPDTPPMGVRENVEVTQSQIAATIAGLLGEDFRAASPQAAPPLPGVGCDAPAQR